MLSSYDRADSCAVSQDMGSLRCSPSTRNATNLSRFGITSPSLTRHRPLVSRLAWIQMLIRDQFERGNDELTRRRVWPVDSVTRQRGYRQMGRLPSPHFPSCALSSKILRPCHAYIISQKIPVLSTLVFPKGHWERSKLYSEEIMSFGPASFEGGAFSEKVYFVLYIADASANGLLGGAAPALFPAHTQAESFAPERFLFQNTVGTSTNSPPSFGGSTGGEA